MREFSQGKTINSEDTWQWWLTFIGNRMQHNYYLYYMIDEIILDNLDIRGIVEIGTGYGALSTVLGLWGIANNIPVLTVDSRKVHDEEVFKALKINFIQADEFSEELKNKINSFINRLNYPIFFVCDGGDKVREFNLWTPLLRPNSIIAVHDWTTELEYSDIKDTAEKYCTPYKQERWNEMNVQLATFKVN